MMSLVVLLLCAVLGQTVPLNGTENTTQSCTASQTQIQENIEKLVANLSARMGNLENSLETLGKDISNWQDPNFKLIGQKYMDGISKVNPELSQPICTPPCENGGHCMINNICNCTTSFFGDRCQDDGAKCGVGNHVEGNRRRPLLWPWMAAVFARFYSGNDEHICDGTVIHRHFVLTSARCVHYNKHDGLSVKLGLSDLKSGPQEHLIWSAHKHPQWESDGGFNIALLETVEPISFNRFVRPVCLPSQDVPEGSLFYKPQSAVKIVNLETYMKSSPFSLNPLPHTSTLTIRPPDECRKYLKEKNKEKYYPSPDHSFCTKSWCFRRSLPMMQSRPAENGSRIWTQVGFGNSDACDFYSGSRLDRLMAWVEETIESASKR